MKNALTITILFCAAMSFAQTSYITSSGDVLFESGSIEKFDTPGIFVNGCYSVRHETWTVTMSIVAGGVITASTPVKREFITVFTKAEIDAFTGAGTGDTEKAQNALDQAVVDYLGTINPAITFTIN